MHDGRRARVKAIAIAAASAFLVLVAVLGFLWWDNGRVRVHSAQQAVDLAKIAAGPSVGALPVRVEESQDFWTIRFGPDEQGRMHNYLVTIWDKRAGTVIEQTVTMDIKLD